MNEEMNKLETKITQDKLRMTGQDMSGDTNALEDFCREFVALLPWLRPHLTKQSNWGSAPDKEECATMIVAREIKECSRTRLKIELKPHTGGATT